jgi:excisionase family DNA binding protein
MLWPRCEHPRGKDMQDDGQLITTKQLAMRMRFSVRKVREWASRGKIPAVRLNKRDLRFHWPSVLEKLKAQ